MKESVLSLVIQALLNFQRHLLYSVLSHFWELVGVVIEEHLLAPSRAAEQSGPSSVAARR